MKIVVLDGFTAAQDDLSWQELEALGDLTVYERTRPEETLLRCQGAEAVLTNKVILSESPNSFTKICSSSFLSPFPYTSSFTSCFFAT